MTDTPRLGLPYPADANPADVPTWMRDLALDLDGLVPSDAQGALGSRPAAGTAGRYYTTTNEGARPITYRDDGTAWRKIDFSPRVTAAALPTNPSDGDEVYWQYDATLNPAIAWHMRWNAAISRWEYLGGPPVIARTDFPINNSVVLPAYHDGGPQMNPVPKSGMWGFRFGCWLGVLASGAGTPGNALYRMLAPTPVGPTLQVQGAPGTTTEVSGVHQQLLSKGSQVTFGVSAFSVNWATSYNRWMEYYPIAIQND
jgi:hypothetical protein